MERRSDVRFAMKPIWGGIVPLRELYGRESWFRLVRLASSPGIVPQSSFVESALGVKESEGGERERQ